MIKNKELILRQYFGYDAFRDGQEFLIDGTLHKEDVLGVMPTGAGKSICFQVPALMLEGITLVISPLISLMKDQVNALTQAGIKAAFLNSSLTVTQYRNALAKAENGEYKIIYVAPERLLADDFLYFAQHCNISMLTVDEAHCISQWGQDFRPSYTKIVNFIESLPNRPVISAYTATATAQVREDIVSLLKMNDPKVLITGFDRKNLYFEVKKPESKMTALKEFLEDKREQTGIIYCLSRKTVEQVCSQLCKEGFAATRYHAGLSDEERKKNQDDFIFDRADVIVATNAFGMGIDKSNVSFVVHYNMPKNIEGYYQEAGRAGRDGESAHCIVFYSPQDVRVNNFLIESNHDTVYTDKQTEYLLKERERQRLKEMTFYCHTNGCLRQYILKYFGERTGGFCGNCGNCNNNFDTVDITIDAQKILSCVYRIKGRYGMKMVVDILRGAKNEKILRLKMDKLSTYGISELSEERLYQIINHLVVNNYLCITADEYPVLKLGEHAKDVLQRAVKLEMKLPEERKKRAASESKKKKEIINSVDADLMKNLKKLRLSIAEKQKVPAYVIFSDSTLIDMCMKLPKNAEDMLNVSGIGKVKLEKYGEYFLKAIEEFLTVAPSSNKGSQSEDTELTLEPPRQSNIYPITGASDNADKKTVSLQDTEEIMLSTIEISEDAITISTMADRINCYLLQIGHKKLSAIKLNDWLIYKGYLKVVESGDNKNYKAATEQGEEISIVSEKRLIRDEECVVNFYKKEAQEWIIDHITELLQWADNTKTSLKRC